MKYFLALCLLFSSGAQAALVQNTAIGGTQVILNAATVTGLGTQPSFVGMLPAAWTLSCTTTGSGTVGATVQLLLWNNALDIPSSTVTLTTSGTAGTSTATSETGGNTPWKFMQVNQTAISGTSAATTCTLGY